MRILKIIGLAAVVAALTFPAVAADGSSGLIKKGAVMMVRPDGSTMMMDSMEKGAMSDAMMKSAKPMSSCMMVMMGDDGKMYVLDDMTMSDGAKVCDVMFKHK